MSKKTSSRWKAIKCPFFHSDEIRGGNNNHIMCEGSTRTSIIRQTFVSADDLRKWERQYCTDIKACENCPIYRTANEKYSDIYEKERLNK